MQRAPPRPPRARRADYTLSHRLRVRWAEVDMQGVVFNPQYLMYFDVAIAEYWRALAAASGASFQSEYQQLYSAAAAVEFHAPARYDEEIDVCARVARIGRSSMAFAFGIWRGAEHLTSGEILYVYTDPQTKRPLPVPPALRAAILAYERAAPPENRLPGG